jgi:pimeloyl-ACP methyl ester carboxylesterase
LTTLFLHGLAGRGAEWDALQARVPAEAPDLQPYGTRDEYVRQVVELIGGRRVTLIGQSLGGHTAMLVAARQPERVERVVMIEASPGRDPDLPRRVRAFFEAHPRAYGSAFDPDHAADTVVELAEREWWDEWRHVTCPALVVRGERGDLDVATAQRMCAENPNAEAVTVWDAGHDVHLEQPEALAGAIERFAQASSSRTSST